MKVIKIESQAHALEVKKYFESLGYDADCIDFEDDFIYYGIDEDENMVDGWRKAQVMNYGWEIIKLPKPFPRMMMVRGRDGSVWSKGLVIGIFNGHYLTPMHTDSIEDIDCDTSALFWSEAKEIEPVKVTIEELMDCYAKEHGIAVENLKVWTN
jgi:hypothetical protein